MSEKPRHRSGYQPDELALVRSACLTVAVTLGSHTDQFCIVGGLVPTLLIDAGRPDEHGVELHPGTNDLDIGLALALLDDKRYAEIRTRLKAEGFEPDVNEFGNTTVQRWRHKHLKVTIDFLMPPPAHTQAGAPRVQNLESDFGALITPGLELAFDERVDVVLEGRTLAGERAKRSIPTCGPAAFTVLKALALAGRGEPKDAFDLVYVLQHSGDGSRGIADRLREHAARHAAVVEKAMDGLQRDFGSIDSIGPMRAAAFDLPEGASREELDEAAADAHGFVDDLMRAWRGTSPK